VLVDIIEHEKNRQWKGLELIPSENFVSSSVMEAVGSVMTNKYSEGYPGESLLWGGGGLFSRALPSLLVQKGVFLDGWVGGGGWGRGKREKASSPRCRSGSKGKGDGKNSLPLFVPSPCSLFHSLRRPLLRRQRVHRPGRDPLPAACAGGLRPRPGEVGRQRAVAVGLAG